MTPHRLVFISNMAAPYQVKLCAELNKYIETEFWFHVQLDANRPEWWRVDLGEKCRVLPGSRFASSGRYLSPSVIPALAAFDPSIVMLGSFAWPSCALGYAWAKAMGRRSVVFTECFRGGSVTLRKASWHTNLLDSFYRGVDSVWTSNAATTTQLREVLPRLRDRVRTAWYPCDLAAHLHIFRSPPSAGRLAFLFANRLVEDYDPLLALGIFKDVHARFPGCTLRMNADGALRAECERRIRAYGLETAVSFLDGLKGWSALTSVYETSDVLLQPAAFSNGSIAVVEAMAAGLGLVVSDRVLWNLDIVRHGVNGFISPPSRERMGELCCEYVQRPELLLSHAREGRETARQFDVDSTARQYVSMLRALAPMPQRSWRTC